MESIDHALVLGECHLRQVLRRYDAYHNDARPRVALLNDAPTRRPIQTLGALIAEPILERLHHPIGSADRSILGIVDWVRQTVARTFGPRR